MKPGRFHQVRLCRKVKSSSRVRTLRSTYSTCIVCTVHADPYCTYSPAHVLYVQYVYVLYLHAWSTGSVMHIIHPYECASSSSTAQMCAVDGAVSWSWPYLS